MQHHIDRKERDRNADPLLISERNAGSTLGVSARTVFNMIARGDLKAVRIGKRKLITVESIRDFIARAGSGQGGVA